MKRRLVWMLATALLVGGMIPGCVSFSPAVPGGNPLQATPTRTPFQPLGLTAQPGAPETETPSAAEIPAVTSTPGSGAGIPLWVDPDLPGGLLQSLNLPGEFSLVEERGAAALRLEPGGEHPVSHWVYALAAPFPTLVQGVSLDQVRRAFSGEAVGPFAGRALMMDASTRAVLAGWWGEPAPGAVQVVPSQDLLDTAWGSRPSWAIIPFEALEPRWTTLDVDGVSPLHKDFEAVSYGLSLPISLQGEPDLAEATRALYGVGAPSPLLPPSNRDPAKLTTLAMTGVTALVRATAFTMEQRGIEYPGQDVRAWLREADLTHISNEVPFAQDCPYPNPVQADVRFCSHPRYIALLEDVGADLVELTGDHFHDWGREAMLLTLDLYRQRGWPTYGGGANLEEGRQALTLEHNGNRLAFIGCNGKGVSFARASASQPGAAACDLGWMGEQVKRLRDEGYLPIVTFQHFEYYTYRAQPAQERDFRAMAQAGAVIVSGSQAHQPQALEFAGEALIHYGLGNLFFDQYEVSPATRQAFIDRHVFYDGRHIGTQLLPILFVDYARPRPMNPAEREELLAAVFSASGW